MSINSVPDDGPKNPAGRRQENSNREMDAWPRENACKYTQIRDEEARAYIGVTYRVGWRQTISLTPPYSIAQKSLFILHSLHFHANPLT